MAYKCLICGSIVNDKNLCTYCGSDSNHIITYFKDEKDTKAVVSSKKTMSISEIKLIESKIKSINVVLTNLIIYYDNIKNTDPITCLKIKDSIIKEVSIFANYLGIIHNDKNELLKTLSNSINGSLKINKELIESDISYFNKKILISEGNKILNNLLKIIKDKKDD